jgi:hypothetical protein
MTDLHKGCQREPGDGQTKEAPIIAPGGVRLSPPSVIPTSHEGACQPESNPAEPKTADRDSNSRTEGHGISRRSLMNMFVGSAALAGASVTPSMAEAFAQPYGPEDASPELRAACSELRDTREEFDAKRKAYDAILDKVRDWQRRNREPSGATPRLYKKWARRYRKICDELQLDASWEEKDAARTRFNLARMKVANTKASDMRELTLKACIAKVFEGFKDSIDLRYEMEGLQCIALSVTRDMAALRIPKSS